MPRFHTLTVIVLACLITTLPLGYAACATIPERLWTGELESGYVHKDQLKSHELWKYVGEKGVRVIIADAVDPGKTPPEIYLFRPGTSECVAQAMISKDTRFLVIDHTLEESGDFCVLLRIKEKDQGVDYTLAFMKLDAGGTYTIDPDAPGGNIIQSTGVLEEIYEDHDVLRGAALILGPFLILPKIVVSSIYFIGEGVSLTVDTFNIPGILLYKDIVNYGQENK